MLITEPHLQSCDDFYEALLAAHQGLATADSHALNARLVLLLANHIGDQATLVQALTLARGTGAVDAVGAVGVEPVATGPVVPAHAGL